MRKLIITSKKSTDRFSDFIGSRIKSVNDGLNKMRIVCSLILISSGLLLSSCSHYYYVPGAQNVPLFREKNQFHISGDYAEGKETNSIDIQTAYSVTNKIGIMADFMSASGGNVSSHNYGKGNYFDGAVGYYKPLGKYGVFEVYGGIGHSKQHHEYNNSYSEPKTGMADLSFIKLYIQPSIGFTSDHFDIAFSTRISRITFNNIENNIEGNTAEYDKLYFLADKSHLFLEPGITVRAGWKSLKVQVQAVYSGYLNDPSLYIGEKYHISLGLYGSFGKKSK